MRRENGSGCLRLRSDGRWEGIYTFTDQNGKTMQRSVYARTKPECKKKLKQKLAEIATGQFLAPSEYTVEQWLNTWKSDFLKSQKPSTIARYSDDIRLYIVPAIGGMKLQKLSCPAIQRFYNQLENRLSAKSIKNVHGTIHSALDKAVAIGLLKDNPSNACTLPKVVKKEMTILTDETVPKFLNAIRGHENENLFLLDICTGMRQGEIIGLCWDAVDFEQGTIRVYRQFRKNHEKAGAKYAFSTLKNGKERTLKPGKVAMNALKAEKVKQDRNKLKHGKEFSNPEQFVFTDEIGRHLCGSTIYERLKRILRTIGLDSVRFHDLRHSYASLALQNGVDMKTVSSNLGHSTLSTTADIYISVTQRMKENAADRVDAYFEKMGG